MSRTAETWWKFTDDGERARAGDLVHAELTRIQSQHSKRRILDAEFVRWYGDPSYNGFSTVGSMRGSPDSSDSEGSQENVIRELVTTLHNKFATNKPVPTIVTTGGTYKERNEAQERELWVRGVFEEDNAYDLLSFAQFHSMAICDGFIGVRDDYGKGRPVAYSIDPWNVHVDTADGAARKPRSIYVVGYEAREVLAARFEEFADLIEDAETFLDEFLGIRQYQSDSPVVNYIECWHLPSKPGADDGRHCVVISNGTILNEQWDFDYFPIVRVPWNPRPFGYFSVGLIEDLVNQQRQLNRVERAISQTLKLMSGAFWAVPKGSNIVTSAISNLIGRAVDYVGNNPPRVVAPEPISQGLIEREDKLRNKLFAQSGVSQMSSQSLKPAGLDSGKALRTYADQEDKRFANAYVSKEKAVVELAQLYCKRAQAMLEADRGAELTVKLCKDSRLREIEWKDADLNSIRVQVLPASSLSTTLAGRIQDVQDLEDLGLINDEDQKRELLQMPDLKADSDLSLAPRNLLLKTLQVTILEQGKAVTPEPYWPPRLALTLGLQVLCYAELQGYPENRIELLRNWVNECKALSEPPPEANQSSPVNAASPPLPGPGAMPAQPPPGMPPGAPVPSGPIEGSPIPAGPMPGAMQ